jgi:hypothetical protein
MFVRRCGRVVLGVFAALLLASQVRAQSVVDARRVEFTPSPEHNALTPSGTPLVERYFIEVFVAGAIWPVSSADLGKPAPQSDGMIRLDFVSLLTAPLANGVTYEAVVEALGPGGRSGGVRTNTFSFGGTACTPVVTPLAASFPAAGGTGSGTVTAAAGCVWNASSSDAWITVTSGATGSGSGSVAFRVAENTATTSRTGRLTIAGATFTVTQAAATCTYGISPASQSFTAAGGAGASAVTAGPACGWTAISNASWITIASGASGLGPGSTGFTVAANTLTTSRTGTLTIAGATFTVTQASAACSYSVSSTAQSFGASGGTGSTIVSTGGGCGWSATSNAPWITVTGGATGSGSGSVGFSVAANSSTVGRTGTLTIAGATFTVTQAGATCSYSVSPTSQTFGGGGGTGISTVTAGLGCEWTASSSAAWITIISGATGTASGSVAFTVAPNTGTTVRTGTLTIAGTTFTVTQSSPSVCMPVISSTTGWFTADGGFGNTTVSAPTACEWDAASNVAWVAVINPGPGRGNGNVAFIVATNLTTATRTGTLTIAGQTYTVTQSGTGCSYSISPNNQAFAAAGGSGSSGVTTTAGCPWAASSNAAWITITGGGSGSGPGTLSFSVAAHTGSATRTGTLLIAGSTFTVTQAPPAGCTASISPRSASFTADGGSGRVTVTAAPTCAWTIASNTAWIVVINGGPFNGSGAASFIVGSNVFGASRTGSLTVAGNTFTVNQTATSGCSYTVSPETLAVTAAGGTSTLTVTTQGGCAWASSGAPSWITLTGSGSGDGTATMVVSANSATAPRTATVTVGGRPVTVTQKGNIAPPRNLRIVR